MTLFISVQTFMFSKKSTHDDWSLPYKHDLHIFRRQCKRVSKKRFLSSFRPLRLLLIASMLLIHVNAFFGNTNSHGGRTVVSSARYTTPAAKSRLFRHHIINVARNVSPFSAKKRDGNPFRSLAATTTSLNMVLTTPESLIEQASTERLLDDLIDENVRTSAKRPIMLQFDPKGTKIWKRWRGTVFSETLTPCFINMAFASIIALIYSTNPVYYSIKLKGFNVLWSQLLSVATFTLTFFVNTSYGLWRKCYELSRRLQGRLNDLGMTLSAHATRVESYDTIEFQGPSSYLPSTYTPESEQVLRLIGRYVRLLNLLIYASFTRSHRPILTPRGMRRLVERGLITPMERQILVDADIPATQRHNAVILWIMRLFIDGRRSGHFHGGDGFEQQFMEKCHVIRSQYGAIGDELQGRMPLAYAHIVQVLVDTILWMYPFMALSSGMGPVLAVLGTGLLTIFYQGLFDLAKHFLDPYDNENYGKGDDPLCVDTLIAETNAGSVRWMDSFEQQPYCWSDIQNGDLKEYILPLRGYTSQEVFEKKEREDAIMKDKLEAINQAVNASKNSTSTDSTGVSDTTDEYNDSKIDDIHALEDTSFDGIQNGINITNIETSLNGNDGGDASSLPSTVIVQDIPLPESTSANANHDIPAIPSHMIKTDGVEIKGDNLVNDAKDREVTSYDVVNEDNILKEVELNADEDVAPDSDEGETLILESPEFAALSEEDDTEVALNDLSDDSEIEGGSMNDSDPGDFFDTFDNAPRTIKEYTEKAAKILQDAEDELRETAAILGASPGAQSDWDEDERENASGADQQTAEGLEISSSDEVLFSAISNAIATDSSFEVLEAAMTKYEEEAQSGLDDALAEAINDGGSDTNNSPFSSVKASDSTGGTSKKKDEKDGEVFDGNASAVSDSKEGEQEAEGQIDVGSVTSALETDEVLVPDNKFAIINDKTDKILVEFEADPMETPLLESDDVEGSIISQQPTEIDHELESFPEKAAKIIKAAKEELRETEAILNAPPGAQSILDLDESSEEGENDKDEPQGTLGSDLPLEEAVVAITTSEEAVIISATTKSSMSNDTMFEVLEMDNISSSPLHEVDSAVPNGISETQNPTDGS